MTGTTEPDQWGFLIDENLDRQTVSYLETDGIRAEHVSTVLFPGADDFNDILPYARQEDLIVVTNNILDFKPLAYDEHEGIVIVYNQRLSAWSMASALFRLVTAYQDRDTLRGTEVLDPYVE